MKRGKARKLVVSRLERVGAISFAYVVQTVDMPGARTTAKE